MKYRPRLESKRIKKVSFWMTEEEHMLLKIISTQTRQTMTNFILKALNDRIKKQGVEEELI